MDHHTHRNDSTKYLKLLEFQEIRKRIQSFGRRYKPQSEDLPVDSALGRICAEDVRASYDMPIRTVSAMDGYAVRSSESRLASISRPIHLKIRGSIYPSDFGKAPVLGARQAYYVATGAPIPTNADSVIRVEEARREKGELYVLRTTPKWKNVSLRAEELRAGKIVLRKQRILSASDVALLMGFGSKLIKAFKVPKIGILSIGNELTKFTRSATPQTEGSELPTTNNYSHLISGFVKNLSAEPILLGIAKDSFSQIKRYIEKGLWNCDMVITIGGSSVGEKDLVVDVLSSMEDSLVLFHGVRVVPIRPAGLATVNGKPIIVIPGHAVSAALTFFTVALPVINILAGLPSNFRQSTITAKITKSITNARAIDALFLVSIKRGLDGKYNAIPLSWGSNVLSNLSRSNGFIWLTPRQTLNKTDEVSVTLLGGSELERIPT